MPIGHHGLKKRDTSISIIFSPWYGAGATGYHDKKKLILRFLSRIMLLAMDITGIGLALAPPCMGPHSGNACEHYCTLTKTSATKKQKPLLPHKMGPGFFLPHEMGPWLRFEMTTQSALTPVW